MLLQMARLHAMLWLNNISLYIFFVYLIFIIHLSTDRHIGCFHILATVNNAAMNMGLQIYFQVTALVFFG